MSETIRTVHPDERETFERFLERCYGHWRGFFPHTYPDLYEAAKADTSPYLVLERDGQILSHVGTFRMTAVVHDCRIPCAGIGGVATAPEARGQGYMSRLMDASIDRMKQWGIAFSVLWGDQQRYQNFGYETCGLKYTITLTRRGFERAGIDPAPIEEVDPLAPASAAAVANFHKLIPCRVDRTPDDIAQKLRRPFVRLFLSDHGYVLARREFGRDLDVLEVASPDELEAELILGALNITFGSTAHVSLGPDEGERTNRLLRAASGWSVRPQGMMRIIDLAALLEAARPLLESRAAGLPPFEVSVGGRWNDQAQWATVRWDGQSTMTIERGPGADISVAVSLRRLTAWLFGGPHAGAEALGPLAYLLPIPVHFPALDHV